MAEVDDRKGWFRIERANGMSGIDNTRYLTDMTLMPPFGYGESVLSFRLSVPASCT
jgi:hypothetical protein